MIETGKRRRVVGGGVVAVLALALGLLSGSPAFAAEKALTFRGTFPLIGAQNVATVTHVDVPASASPGQALDVPFTLDVNAGNTAADGLRLVGAKTVSGSISASVTLTGSDGSTTSIPVELPIAPTPVPATGPLVFTAAGSVGFSVPAGFPAGTATSSVDPTASTHVVTDSALGEFDVALTLSPPDQDTVLGTTEVG